MHRRSPQTCEVKLGEAWRSVSLAEAKGIYAMAQKRCPACHGQVMVAGNYTREGGLSMQHRRAHHGCPLMPDRYVGVPTRHPNALK